MDEKTDKEVTILDIIKSVRQELRQLRKERDGLDKSLKAIKFELKSIEDKEFGLRDRLTELISIESELNRKRMDFEKKMLRLKDKISKVSRINKELNDVWT